VIVIVAFNQDATASVVPGAITFTALMELLAMPEDIIKRVMHSLTCGK
jgi:hypothetical protein